MPISLMQLLRRLVLLAPVLLLAACAHSSTPQLDQRFGDRVPRVLLHAAICRRELSMEIDGVHG